MKLLKCLSFLLISAVAVVFTSCYREDPGPLQAGTRDFDVVDFDRIEAGDAVDVTLQQGSTFSIHTYGDRRDLDDLQILKSGSTLIIKFSNGRNRQYTSYVTIIMPTLKGIKFSGAVTGRALGFDENTNRFDLSLSGASNAQIKIKAEEIYASVSGASQAELTGSGKKIDVGLSGASTFTSFDYSVEEARVIASGASHAKVKATDQLTVNASGASEVRYRGEPQVDADVSGASWVGKD